MSKKILVRNDFENFNLLEKQHYLIGAFDRTCHYTGSEIIISFLTQTVLNKNLNHNPYGKIQCIPQGSELNEYFVVPNKNIVSFIEECGKYSQTSRGQDLILKLYGKLKVNSNIIKIEFENFYFLDTPYLSGFFEACGIHLTLREDKVYNFNYCVNNYDYCVFIYDNAIQNKVINLFDLREVTTGQLVPGSISSNIKLITYLDQFQFQNEDL
jgi:hypothetical protein